MTVCQLCGSYGAIDVDGFMTYRIPPEWDHLCRDCAEQVNTHTAEEMDDAELIAAIMDDSIGYASPHHAAQHVEQFRDGEDFAFCERAVSCYPAETDEYGPDDRMVLTGKAPGSLDKLIESARAHWCAMDADKQETLLGFAEQWEQVEDPGDISAVSMHYPTLNI